MTRPIKFRAWDGEKMIPFGLWDLDSGTVLVGDFPHITDYPIMQFTGLLDKHDKPIYEGDIVMAWFDLGPAGEDIYTVEVKITPFGPNLEQWAFEENRLPEVIGNIHENKDLLNE